MPILYFRNSVSVFRKFPLSRPCRRLLVDHLSRPCRLEEVNCQKSQALLAIKIGILVLLRYMELGFHEKYFSGCFLECRFYLWAVWVALFDFKATFLRRGLCPRAPAGALPPSPPVSPTGRLKRGLLCLATPTLRGVVGLVLSLISYLNWCVLRLLIYCYFRRYFHDLHCDF